MFFLERQAGRSPRDPCLPNNPWLGTWIHAGGRKMDVQIISDGSPKWSSVPDGNSGKGERSQRCGTPGRAGPWAGGQPELQEVPKEFPNISCYFLDCPGTGFDPDPVGFPGKTPHFAVTSWRPHVNTEAQGSGDFWSRK